MKKLSVIIAGLVFVFGLSNAVVAQDTDNASHDIGITVPSIAFLDIEGDTEGGINLTVSATGLEAGEAVDFTTVSNNSLWLNYTAIKAGSDRQVSAKLENINLPTGVTLKLKVENQTGGTGNLGEVVSGTAITLDNSAKPVISGIGSCYTGNGTGNGHQLIYSLDMDSDSYSDLVSGNDYSATVVYTITESN